MIPGLYPTWSAPFFLMFSMLKCEAVSYSGRGLGRPGLSITALTLPVSSRGSGYCKLRTASLLLFSRLKEVDVTFIKVIVTDYFSKVFKFPVDFLGDLLLLFIGCL